MQKQKIKIGVCLFILGLIGVLSILTASIPLDNIPPEVLQQFSGQALQILSLINPTVLLIIAVITGSVLYDKVNLQVPALEKLLTGKSPAHTFTSQLQYGIAGGFIAGASILLVAALFSSFLPQEFVEMGERFQPSLLMRFLYGGITEEILMRFGLMTFLVWLLYKLTKKLQAAVYWAGIILASVLFGLGHLPVAFTMVASPSPGLISYIILGNSLGGIVFGWLYWKKGLEAAFIAHILSHVVIVMVGSIVDN